MGFAAAAVDEPDLGAFFFVGAGRGEGEEFAVGGETRGAGGFWAVGHLDGLRAVPGGHEDFGDGFVFGGVYAGYGVGDPFAVGGDFWIGDVADLREVIEGDGALCLREDEGAAEEG